MLYKRPALRVRLQAKLTLSYLAVGVAITLLALFATRWVLQSSAETDRTVAMTVQASVELASTLNAAFEEGFSYALSQDVEEKQSYFGKIELFESQRRKLVARPGIPVEVVRELEHMKPATDEAVSAAKRMFLDAEDDGHVNAVSYQAYETGMDALSEQLSRVVVSLRDNSVRGEAEARRHSDWAMLGIGTIALLLAAAMGHLLGRMVTRPLRRLREAAIAFGRGDREASFHVASDDEIGELAHAFSDMGTNVRGLLATVNQQKAHLFDIFASMKEMLFVCDAAGGIVSANRSACLALGFEENELIGKTLASLLANEESSKALRLGEKAQQDVALRDRTGREFVVALSTSTLADQGLDLARFVCVAQDLTERRRLEADLVQAQRLESLGRFTAGIAHEMGSPLSAVRASLSTAIELIGEYATSIGNATVEDADHRAIAKELAEAVELADTATERVCSFVRSIRAQTRGTTTSLERVRFDAVEVVSDALALVGHAAAAGHTKLHFHPAVAHADLDGNPGRIAQIVTNLVSNAIDANVESGGQQVDIDLDQTPDGLTLKITDGGFGIPEAIRARIFEPLFTTKQIGKGTGLGLAIVHDIVKGDFGGSIEVTNRPGGGAVFAVHLPCRASA